MKATELRIGNYVDITKCTEDPIEEIMYYEKVTSVEQRFIGSQSSTGNLAEFIDPIPLTEEWLLRFGFKESKTFFGHNSFEKDGYHLIKNGKYFEFLVIGSSVILAKIKYVHKLQNLYFALMGEELEMKDKTERKIDDYI